MREVRGQHESSGVNMREFRGQQERSMLLQLCLQIELRKVVPFVTFLDDDRLVYGVL